MRLPRSAESVHAARTWLHEQLAATPPADGQAAEDLLVMASELITNVIVHTSSDPQLAVEDLDGHLRVDVSDDDGRDPVLHAAKPTRVGGNGLRIVDAWSDDWGVEHHPDDGKTVWFTVATVRA